MAELERPNAALIYGITCALCGQRWQQRAARPNEALQCPFCGTLGRLKLGPLPPEPKPDAHVEAWLDSGRREWY